MFSKSDSSRRAGSNERLTICRVALDLFPEDRFAPVTPGFVSAFLHWIGKELSFFRNETRKKWHLRFSDSEVHWFQVSDFGCQKSEVLSPDT